VLPSKGQTRESSHATQATRLQNVTLDSGLNARYNQPHQNYRRSTADPDKSVVSSASSSFTTSQRAPHLHHSICIGHREVHE